MFESTKYILKKKNKNILTFNFRTILYKDGYLLNQIKKPNIIEEKLLPLDFNKTNIPLSKKIEKWIKKRRVHMLQKESEIIFNLSYERFKFNYDNIMNYIKKSYGLSLNDDYWITEYNSNLTWEEVNLFDNEWDSNIENKLLGIKLKETKSKLSPAYTTKGNSKKCWVKEENKMFLYKGTSYNNDIEQFENFYMKQIADIFELKTINIELVKLKNEILAKTKCFTSKDKGYMPILYFLKKEYRNLKREKLLKELYKIINKKELNKILFFDAIIENVDNNLTNYGFIIDNNNNKIIENAPLFDYGHSILFLLKKNKNSMKNKHRTGYSLEELLYKFNCEDFKEYLIKLEKFKFKKNANYNIDEKILKTAESIINSKARECIKLLKK